MVNSAMVTTQEDVNVMQWKANTLFQSGLLPSHIKNANQIIAIDMMARELNIPTWQAINGINVIQGKPTVSPQLMLALIERSGKLEDIKIDSTAERCIVTMKRRGRSQHSETFSMADAKSLKSAKWENNRKIEISLADKDNYQQQPAVMLKWRAISACARVVFPDVLMGMYTTEEIAPDTVRIDAEGDFEIVETPSNVVDIERARKTLGSGEGERRIPQRDIHVTDGNTARKIEPELRDPEETGVNNHAPHIDAGMTKAEFEQQSSPNGTHAPAPSGDVPKDPTPSENWCSKGTISEFGVIVRKATGLADITPDEIARLGLGDASKFFSYAMWNKKYDTREAAIDAVKAAFEAEMTAKSATPKEAPSTVEQELFPPTTDLSKIGF